MTPSPRISVITPNFNYGHSLERTIKSVLDQTYPNVEYIVMDGGSTDNSVDVIRRYQDRLAYWHSEKDAGQYDAINKGMMKATGDILAWLNSDDIYFPWTLSVVASVFRAFEEVDWITGMPTVLTASGAPVRVEQAPCFPRSLLACGLFGPSKRARQPRLPVVQQEGTFWRRELWETAGPIPLQYRLAGDFVLWTQFARHADLTAVGVPLGGFTLTGANRSRTAQLQYHADVDTYIASLASEDHRLYQRATRTLRIWSAARRVPGVRKLARALLQSPTYNAPVVQPEAEPELQFSRGLTSLLP